MNRPTPSAAWMTLLWFAVLVSSYTIFGLVLAIPLAVVFQAIAELLTHIPAERVLAVAASGQMHTSGCSRPGRCTVGFELDYLGLSTQLTAG